MHLLSIQNVANNLNLKNALYKNKECRLGHILRQSQLSFLFFTIDTILTLYGQVINQ